MKKITRKGRGEFPMDCPMEDTRVVVKAKVRSARTDASSPSSQDWVPFMGPSIDAEIDVATGMGDVPLVLDAAVRLMLPGEVSVLTTVVDDAMLQFCRLVPKGERLDIEVELVRFDPAPPIQLLEPGEKLAKAAQFKEEGNTLYKKGLIPLAKSKYNKAINCVGKGFEFSEEEIDEALGIKVSCMLNLAACAQQAGSYGEAIQWCDRVLEDILSAFKSEPGDGALRRELG